MGKQLHATIEVGATPRRVWQVLTGFAAYPDRNPFITRASGTARPGERPHLRMQPPGGRGVALRPVVLEADPAGGCAGSANRSGSAASWCPLPLPRLTATPSPDSNSSTRRSNAAPSNPARNGSGPANAMDGYSTTSGGELGPVEE
jgi:Polyketide cyclase / dehydrase and lipid transport